MKTEIIEQKPLTLIGLVETGENISDIDIAGLWQRFTIQGEDIQHQVDPDRGYELHIHLEEQPPRHITLIGVAVKKAEDLPLEMFAKDVPGGTYVRFTHYFKNGGFGEAFKQVYDWLEESEFQPRYPFDIQVYDECFNGPDDPGSVIEILVPVVQKSDV